MKKLLWIASLCGMISLPSAIAETHMKFVYWDASSGDARPPRAQLADPAILQPCTLAEQGPAVSEQTEAGRHHIDGYLVGLIVAFDRPHTGWIRVSVAFSDYDEAVRYLSHFPDHYIFPPPRFRQ